jgi:hypothetical protein
MQFNVTIVFYTIRVNFGEDIPVLLFVTITIMAAVANVIVIKSRYVSCRSSYDLYPGTRGNLTNSMKSFDVFKNVNPEAYE